MSTADHKPRKLTAAELREHSAHLHHEVDRMFHALCRAAEDAVTSAARALVGADMASVDLYMEAEESDMAPGWHAHCVQCMTEVGWATPEDDDGRPRPDLPPGTFVPDAASAGDPQWTAYAELTSPGMTVFWCGECLPYGLVEP